MSWPKIEERLKVAMGLDVASIGSTALVRAVQGRRVACGLQDVDDYWRKLSGSDAELQELIEAVVVSETWFFRDSGAFAAMVQLIKEEWLSVHRDGVVRLLSLPCSTGEEPYSMAMALLDAGVRPDRFRIDGVDISERAVALARRGIYGKNSFRGSELGFRERHFTAGQAGWRVDDAVRASVTLRQGNLFADDFSPGALKYTAIFCRNVLIYFDRPTQDRAILMLDRILADDGLLFVAPSETNLLLSHGFVAIKIPLAFAFRRAPKASVIATKPVRKPAAPIAATPAIARPTRAAARVPVAPPAPKPAAIAASDADVAKAQRLADQGHLVEAAKLCEAWLRDHPPSVRALQLMGVIREASGNVDDAKDYYRKALYLDPAHQESLVHLAFLLEKQGDIRGARLLRERAQRAAQRAEG
jgi:chemotaxis protein methyltransferase WspC